MNIWLATILALLPPMGIAIAGACHGRLASRLVAVQLVTGITTIILAVMTFAFDQSSFIDLAVCVAMLSLPGTLLMALFVERWL